MLDLNLFFFSTKKKIGGQAQGEPIEREFGRVVQEQ